MTGTDNVAFVFGFADDSVCSKPETVQPASKDTASSVHMQLLFDKNEWVVTSVPLAIPSPFGADKWQIEPRTCLCCSIIGVTDRSARASMNITLMLMGAGEGRALKIVRGGGQRSLQ